uniref:Uncharacterized protein n=1 Tax=Xiphophorus couchianus TaxID=32473 RepID=A0A3B5KSH6_9TELE
MSMFSVVRKQMKSHPSVSLECCNLIYLCFLLCLLSLFDIETWDRTNNPEPWNKLGPNQQYKFFSVNTDYSKLKKDRPDF